MNNETLTMPHLLRLAIAIAVAQGVFWFLIQPADRPRFDGMQRIDRYVVAPLSQPTLEAVGALPADAWRTREGFDYDCCDVVHFAVRWTFNLHALPPADQGLLVGVSADNFFLYMNGHAVVDAGRLAPTSTYHGRWTRGIQRVSRAMLHPGENEIVAITARNGGGYTDTWHAVVGDYERMREIGARRTFMVNDLRLINMILIGATAVFAAVLIPITVNRAFAVWLMLLAAAYALRIAFHRWWDPPLGPEWFTVYHFAVSALLPVAWFNFLDAWSGRGWPRVRRALVAVYAACCLFFALLITHNKHLGYDVASDVTHWLYLLLGSAAALLFVWRMRAPHEGRYVEVAAFVLGITAMMVDAVYELLYDRAQGNLQVVLPAVLMGLVAAVLARNVRLYESMSAFNAQLTQTLEKREQEIAARYAELQRTQRERDLAEERQRILQDMHDGIGGKLTGLLLQARNTQADAAVLALGIEDALHDLRLVIESLDADDVSFAEIMQSMQRRLQQQLRGADIRLRWQVQGEPQLESTQTLQVLRVLQEAVTNAVRHAAATELQVQFGPCEYGNSWMLKVRDNGRGLPVSDGDSDPARDGVGFNSMRRRAQALGGDLRIDATPPGLLVELRFPAYRYEPNGNTIQSDHSVNTSVVPSAPRS